MMASLAPVSLQPLRRIVIGLECCQVLAQALLELMCFAGLAFVVQSRRHFDRAGKAGWLGVHSYASPREYVWWTGCAIVALLMLAAFTGYVLVWGQISYWALTVITNLATAIPLVGSDHLTPVAQRLGQCSTSKCRHKL